MNQAQTLFSIIILGCLAGVMLLAIISEMDFREAKDEALIYQMMVCEGTWPDYKGLKPECEENKDD